MKFTFLGIVIRDENAPSKKIPEIWKNWAKFKICMILTK
jgi:hypothetical protein